MDNGASIHDQSEKAKEKLRFLKKAWGLTWRQMQDVLGGIPEASLRTYASYSASSPDMPARVSGPILSLPLECPELDIDKPSAGVVLALHEGRWLVLDKPEIGFCVVCGKPYIPAGYGQKYCTGRGGDCHLAMRRERRRIK